VAQFHKTIARLMEKRQREERETDDDHVAAPSAEEKPAGADLQEGVAPSERQVESAESQVEHSPGSDAGEFVHGDRAVASDAIADAEYPFRIWDDQLYEELVASPLRGDAERLAQRYQSAFPAAYKAATDPADAVRDIACFEALAATDQTQIELRDLPRAGESLTALKLYVAKERIVLSDFMPVLENLGLRVFDQDAIIVTLPDVQRALMHTFLVQDAVARGVNVAREGQRLVPAIHALRDGLVENDPLNSLVLHAGLDWRAVDLLRAYAGHIRQIMRMSRAALIDALTANPDSARRLFQCFTAKLDPEGRGHTSEERQSGPVREAEAALLESLERVESLPHDRALRALAAAIAATVRTNFFTRRDDRSAIAIKLDCVRLPYMPRPRPMYETYVHGVRVEGIHVRAGRVARGGIRLSDRPDDFRSEILGLMKTQVVKNAVIVPVGAKGGFVVKGASSSTASATEAEEAYRSFISALLSITDNLKDGRIISPPDQIVYDEPDPYLVVAADKGTASFSDAANEIALGCDFWLGDAFASGGSTGYDHKRLGITARGVWESVRQHFRELGRDVEREPITVVGIGDMNGDVFGNGMLRLKNIRLRAAFNHRHIFLDPDPDPDVSYRERERLFRLPRSGWSDYDPALLSRGGGVYLRSAKTIALSPEARRMLGVSARAPSGEEVVQAILKMEADLLWNGGIGTYVKAGGESHADVGDPANDAVRVSADELRVKVIAEGGNLGLTQQARIELSLHGGRVNTDAIDNSGGVDLSDHEVNLKVALQPIVAHGRLTFEERNRVLVSLAEEVCEGVLAHNRRQALALSLDQERSRTRLSSFRDLMSFLEQEAGLDRSLEKLPTREMLRARRGAYLGLTRPELAVLLAHTKIDLQRRVLESSIPDDPEAERFLRLYFPKSINERFGDAPLDHPLRREIITVELVNRLVDFMGMTFALRVARETGRDLADVVKAWVTAMIITEGEEVLQEIESIRVRLPPAAELACWFAFERALERSVKWMLETQPLATPIAALTARFGESGQYLMSIWTELLTEELRDRYEQEVAALERLGTPRPFVEWVCRIAAFAEALEINVISQELHLPVETVAHAYLHASALVDVDWLRRSLTDLVADDRWERRAIEGLLEGLVYARRQLARSILACQKDGSTVEQCLRDYATVHAEQIRKLSDLIGDLKAVKRPSLAAALVVMRELGRLVGRGEIVGV
jgi:glutamate dehydrogenase